MASRPFFHHDGRGWHLHGTHLARERPHVLPCPSSVGFGYWVAVYRGKASFNKSPSAACDDVIAKVDSRYFGDTVVMPSPGRRYWKLDLRSGQLLP